MASFAPLTYGTVTGRFVAITSDSAEDPDTEPEAVALTGTVQFVPSARVVSIATAVPPTTAFPQPIDAELDSEGYIIRNGVRGVKLLATDNAFTNPTNFKWTAVFNMALPGGSPISYASKPITVPANVTIDITLAGTATADGGTMIPEWQAAANATATNAALAQAARVAAEQAAAGATGSVAGVASVNTRTGAVVLTKADVNLGNVDNTTDVGKPISALTQAALDAKAPLNNPTFTGTVAGVSKSMVGLGNVDNTADAAKPISTATQTALDGKAATSHTHGLSGLTATGTKDATTFLRGDNTWAVPPGSGGGGGLSSVSSADITDASTVGRQVLTAASTTAAREAIGAGTSNVTSKADLGLGSVDNTADAAKPISTATQTALNAKAPINNPTFTGTVGGVTKAMVGLANVDNTADSAKPVSTAQAIAIAAKPGVTLLTAAATIPGGTPVGFIIRDPA